MSLEKIEQIKSLSKSLKLLPTETPGGMDTAVMRERFDTMMHDEGTKTHKTEPVARDPNQALSPIEAARESGSVTPVGKPTSAGVVEKVHETTNRIDTVKARLAADDLSVKPSMTGMLRKKLLHIDSSIEAALQKSGAKESVLKTEGGGELVDGVMNPIHRFIGLLTNGQHNLNMIEEHVKTLGKQEALNPTALMSVQLKVARVQQEIELFTSLLNKALESTKTIMNIQV